MMGKARTAQKFHSQRDQLDPLSPCGSSQRALLLSTQGQAVIEFILVMVIALVMIMGLNFGLRRVMNQVWGSMICDITAPCPHCDADPDINTAVINLNRSLGGEARGCRGS